MTDPFGNELELNMIVLQDCRKDRSCLRNIVEIDEERKPDQVRLGDRRESYHTNPVSMRPTWVNRSMVTKWCNQEAFNVQ